MAKHEAPTTEKMLLAALAAQRETMTPAQIADANRTMTTEQRWAAEDAHTMHQVRNG